MTHCQSAPVAVRNTNLELYRIICMLMIVAHHFVVHSALFGHDGLMTAHPASANTLFLLLFGMWGKVGIDCFVMITGYFMCKSRITIRKFLKLLLTIYCFKIAIFAFMLYEGHEVLSARAVVELLLPFKEFDYNFTDCFMLFYLLLPFWSILVEHMTRRQHLALTGLLLTVYTALGSIPGFGLTFNYTMWFGVVFLIASYIRLYPSPLFDDVRLWRRISLAAIALAMASVAVSHYLLGHGEYTLVREPNCIFPIAVAVATFLWFKNIRLAYSKSINAVAATTFGVYLIHDNSSAMEQWLWCDTVDAASRFALPLWQFVLFSLLTVLAVFCVCSAIERLRELAIEAPLFTLMSKV